MTGTARVNAALAGLPADRIPIFCNVLDQGARELGVSVQTYYSRGDLVAEGQLRMREKYGHDNVWSLFYVGKEAELLGCRSVRFATDGPPNVEHFVIQSLDDIGRLQVPEPLADHPAFAEPKRCLQMLRQEVGGRYPICAYISSTMTLPALLMGMEKWMELLFLGPASAREALLDTCHRFFVAETAAYRQAGADLVIYSNPFGSLDIVPRKFFTTTALPWIERDIAAIGPAGVVYYCGMSRMNPVLDQVLARTGLQVYYLSPLDDVAEGVRTIDGRALTCGLINDNRMIDWTPAETRAEVKRILAAGMRSPKFLFGTGVMPLAIPESNIRAMVDTVVEFGRREGNPA